MPDKSGSLSYALYKAFLCMAMVAITDPKVLTVVAGVFKTLKQDISRPAEALQIEAYQARDVFKIVADSMMKLIEGEIESELDK